MYAVDQPIFVSGGDTGVSRSYNNPVSATSMTHPGKFGKAGKKPATVPYSKPKWYQDGGGRISTGRMGSEAGLIKGPGPVTDADFVENPSMMDQTLGWPTNHTVPYAKIIKQFEHRLMNVDQRYQLIITRREKKDQPLLRKGMESRRYTSLNVPAWNYLQAMSEKKPASRNDVLNAEMVWKDWAVEGVVRSEEGAEEQHYKDEVGMERLLNNVIKGYCYTFNAWKNNVVSGTRLYLILVKKKVKREFVLNPWGEDVKNLPEDQNITDMPFQLQFWADYRYDYPPNNVLRYEDEFGVSHTGKAIYVGYAEKGTAMNLNKRMMEQVDVSMAALLSQPQFWIFFDG